MRKPRPLGKMMTALKPPAATHSAGGIELPEIAQEQIPSAIIEEVGDEVTKVKPGDEVLYNSYGGQVYLFEGREFHMLNEEDVIAKVVDDD